MEMHCVILCWQYQYSDIRIGKCTVWSHISDIRIGECTVWSHISNIIAGICKNREMHTVLSFRQYQCNDMQ